jgi:hypothetical protein
MFRQQTPVGTLPLASSRNPERQQQKLEIQAWAGLLQVQKIEAELPCPA